MAFAEKEFETMATESGSSRRDFLRSTLAAGTGLAAASGCRPESDAASRAGAGAPEAIPDFELDEMTIADLQQGMESGRFTARSLAELYLGRIEAIDRNGPSLHSVLEVHGLPVGISFFGAAWTEPVLLACAFAFEQANSFRRKPSFRATL
jgi:hypothetical protein